MSLGEERVATSENPQYTTMESYPLGVKALLLTRGGVAVVGALASRAATIGYAGWAPLPKVPKEVREPLFPYNYITRDMGVND